MSSGVLGLVLVEARRLIGRRVVKALLLLPLLPVVVAAILRGHYVHVFESLRALGVDTSLLWLLGLGATPKGLENVMSTAALPVAGLALLNIGNLAWLVSVIFAAYLFASDVSSGRLSLLLVRPVSRDRLLLVKLLAAYAVLTLLYLEAGLASYASFYLLAGRQSMPWLVAVYALASGAASIPMLAVAGFFGLRSGKSGTTIAAGLVVYFVLGFVTGLLVALPYIVSGKPGEAVRATAYANAAEPVHSFMLPRLVLQAAVSGLDSRFSGVEVADLLAVSASSTISAIAVLVAALIKYFRRLDLRAP